jgi:DNA modification methylase
VRRNPKGMSSSQGRHTAGADNLIPARDLSSEFAKYIGKQVSYATHGIHKYPAKFIPQIPRFCIDSYSDVGDVVLDPFMGSGTTLLESYVSGRDSFGVDIHPLARLIAKVKTTPLDPRILVPLAEDLLDELKADRDDDWAWVPEIPNREHWFRDSVLSELATVKKHIWGFPEDKYKDFFRICLSSIIRKVSNSDNDSLIPEVTSFQKKLDEQGKTSYDVFSKFENTVRSKLLDAAHLWRLAGEVRENYGSAPQVSIVGEDARNIDIDDSSVDLAVTSPPYASAVHYVGVHKLEMFWLDMMKDTSELDSRVLGTSRAYASEYRSWNPETNLPRLKPIIGELLKKDKKSAYIVYKYFEGMRDNFVEVNRVLKRNAFYCVVVGENAFRRVRIPTYRVLADVAIRSGFELRELFVYDVINRHLDIPRWNDSRIERDHILVLRKRRSPKKGSL